MPGRKGDRARSRGWPGSGGDIEADDAQGADFYRAGFFGKIFGSENYSDALHRGVGRLDYFMVDSDRD